MTDVLRNSFCMDLERLRSERGRVLADLARLDQRVQEMQHLAADGHVSSEKADLVFANCAEDKKQLTDRLTVLDACLAELRSS
jgi:hypothetical protein